MPQEAMTQYHWEGEIGSPDDPNRDQYLCSTCRENYVDFWTAMWDEYNASRG